MLENFKNTKKIETKSMKEFIGRFPSREGNKRIEKTQSYCDRI